MYMTLSWGPLHQRRMRGYSRRQKEPHELAEDGLLEEDHYLLEVNLDNLENISGERQEYWPLAIRATRQTCRRQEPHNNNNSKNNNKKAAPDIH